MEYFVVHGPGDVQGMPVKHSDEYIGFVVDCYGLDDDGRRFYDSAFFSRPKGCDKSGLGARLALFEALGPARFDGWAEGGEVYRDPWGLGFEYVYEAGEPMGRPVSVPYIRIMATEEGQTGNVFDTVHFNLTDEASLLSSVPGLDVGITRINLPDGGEITPSTASSSSKDGGKETFVVFDETHLYSTPELRRMYATVTRNLRKRKRLAEPWYLETTTMFAPGQDSVAERTYEEAEAIRDGRKKRGRARLMYDHRWGECPNLKDEDALRDALIDAYGDAMEWLDLESLVDDFYDTRNDSADGRRYFLNSRTVASNAWMDPVVARACGAFGVRVEKPRHLAGALRDAFKHKGPALVDIVTDPNALSIPPKISAEMVTGFALSASKIVLDGGVGRMLQMARSNLRNVPRP
ncbi:thiamine pyrophosphate-dependent enzyme [Streptomyces cadmiisoli]